MVDLIIHIGLRKTGTTFLQRYIFPKFNVEFLSRDVGNSLHEDVFSGKANLDKLFSAFPSTTHSSYLVSKESISLPPTNRTILESVVLSNHSSRLEDYPIMKRLPDINSSWTRLYGGRVKIILGTRDPVDLLPSEYAQQSRFISNPCTDDFERRVRLYIQQRNEYTNFEKWFELLSELIGEENVLMIPTVALSKKDILSRMARFSGGEYFNSETDNSIPEIVNTRRKGKNEWGLRVFSTDRVIKRVVPRKYRNNKVYRVLRLVLRKTVHGNRARSIFLSQETRNSILAYHEGIVKDSDSIDAVSRRLSGLGQN